VEDLADKFAAGTLSSEDQSDLSTMTEEQKNKIRMERLMNRDWESDPRSISKKKRPTYSI